MSRVARRSGRRTKGERYVVGNSRSLRPAGMKGRRIFIEMAEDGSRFTIEGEELGRIEVPLDTITSIRAGIETWTRAYATYRCLIWSCDARMIALDGTLSWFDYNDFVLHLAREMERRGRFDRVQRGLRAWKAFAYLLMFSVVLLPCLAVYEMWSDWPPRYQPWMPWIVRGIGIVSVSLYLYALWIWFHWYRPRRARDLDDLARILPLHGGPPRGEV